MLAGANAANDIFVKLAVDLGQWQHIDGKLKQVQITENRIYGCNARFAVFTRPITTVY